MDGRAHTERPHLRARPGFEAAPRGLRPGRVSRRAEVKTYVNCRVRDKIRGEKLLASINVKLA